MIFPLVILKGLKQLQQPIILGELKEKIGEPGIYRVYLQFIPQVVFLFGMNPMDLKRGIDKATEVVVAALQKSSQPCKNNAEIAQVGTISANSDTSVGDIIAEAMEKVGKEGVITVEEGSTLENELDRSEEHTSELQSHLKGILDSKNQRMNIVKTELLEIRDQYGVNNLSKKEL